MAVKRNNSWKLFKWSCESAAIKLWWKCVHVIQLNSNCLVLFFNTICFLQIRWGARCWDGAKDSSYYIEGCHQFQIRVITVLIVKDLISPSQFYWNGLLNNDGKHHIHKRDTPCFPDNLEYWPKRSSISHLNSKYLSNKCHDITSLLNNLIGYFIVPPNNNKHVWKNDVLFWTSRG